MYVSVRRISTSIYDCKPKLAVLYRQSICLRYVFVPCVRKKCTSISCIFNCTMMIVVTRELHNYWMRRSNGIVITSVYFETLHRTDYRKFLLV